MFVVDLSKSLFHLVSWLLCNSQLEVVHNNAGMLHTSCNWLLLSNHNQNKNQISARPQIFHIHIPSYLHNLSCVTIDKVTSTVINKGKELIYWYTRKNYCSTGFLYYTKYSRSFSRSRPRGKHVCTMRILLVKKTIAAAEQTTWQWHHMSTHL